jgi:hypothetical protein
MYICLLVQCHPSHLTPCSPTKSNLYFDISFATVMSEMPIQTSYISRTKSHVHFPQMRSFIQSIHPSPRPFVRSLFFLRQGAVSPMLQAGGPPPAGCSQLLIQYICTYPPYLEAVSSIRNLRMCHTVVTRDPLNM